jgi:hypothetical protein
MRLNVFMWIVAAGSLVGSGLGCNSGAGELPALIPVKGKVTYKGQPVTKGVIKFEPDGGFGRKASGQIQADGTFVLTTDKEGDGVVAGHHQVSISGTGSQYGKEVVPKKYTQRASSQLTAEVDREHTEFQFELR